MAKISQDVNFGGGGSAMPKPASPAASSGAAIAGAVSNIAATGVNLWQQNEQRKTNEAVANTHGKFLDLQDDAIRQQQEAQGIQAQVAGFHEDGVLDPKEASLLEQLSKRAAKLDLLDANQRQLRKNALLKQSLNDPALARVAHQVTNIFGGANVNPVADPQQEAIRQRMDEKFGAGQWSPVQVGEEIGRQNYMRQVSKEATENFTAASHKAAAFAAAASDDIVATISKEIKLSGAWLPESQVAVGTQLAQLHAETRAQITRASQANKAGVDSATTRKALEDVDNQFAFMKNLINEDLDPFTLQNRLEQYNTLKQATISGQMPTALQILGNSGGNAGATQSNMFELYTAMQNPKTRKLLEDNGASPALLETQVAAATDWFTNGAAAVDAKMVEWFSPEFRKTIGVKLLGTKATQQDQEATDRVTAELGKPKGTDDDTKASLSAIMANIDVITAKGSEGQAELAILNHFKDFTSRQNFSPEEIAQITVVDGKIDMGALIDSHGRMGQIKTRNIRSLISEFNSAIQTAGADASEIIAAVMKANPVPEVEEEPEAEEGPTAREQNAAARQKSLARNNKEDTRLPPAERAISGKSSVVQEAITNPEELSRIEAEAASLSPVDPADLMDKPATPVAAQESGMSQQTVAAVSGQSEMGKRLFGALQPTRTATDVTKKFGSVDKIVDTLVQSLRGDVTSPSSGKSVGLEGFEDSLYVPTGGESGLTIGTGIDLKFQSEKGLIKKGVPKDIAAKLKPYYGKDDKSLEGQKPLSKAEVEKLDRAVVKHSLMELRKDIPSYDSFPPSMQLALYTAAHQYGNKFLDYNLRKQAIDADRRAILNNLSTWSDSTSGGAGEVIEDKYKIMGENSHQELLAEQNYILTMLSNAYEDK